MALIPQAEWPSQTESGDADYPQGKARDRTPGETNGTPYTARWRNDVFGFFQAILLRFGVTPTGNPDTALNSQYLTALLLSPKIVKVEGPASGAAITGSVAWPEWADRCDVRPVQAGHGGGNSSGAGGAGGGASGDRDLFSFKKTDGITTFNYSIGAPGAIGAQAANLTITDGADTLVSFISSGKGGDASSSGGGAGGGGGTSGGNSSNGNGADGGDVTGVGSLTGPRAQSGSTAAGGAAGVGGLTVRERGGGGGGGGAGTGDGGRGGNGAPGRRSSGGGGGGANGSDCAGTGGDGGGLIVSGSTHQSNLRGRGYGGGGGGDPGSAAQGGNGGQGVTDIDGAPAATTSTTGQIGCIEWRFYTASA